MTTHHRRTPQERAADILRTELSRQMANTAKSRAAFERDQAAEATTRQAIAMLDQLPLPGIEPPSGVDEATLPTPSEIYGIMAEAPSGADDAIFGIRLVIRNQEDGVNHPIAQEPSPSETTATPGPQVFVPHRQKIGEKAPSACPHSQTGIVKGVRRCFVCNKAVDNA